MGMRTELRAAARASLAFYLYLFVYICVLMLCLHVYLHYLHAWHPQTLEKGMDSSKVELQTVWGHYVGPRNKPESSGRGTRALIC